MYVNDDSDSRRRPQKNTTDTPKLWWTLRRNLTWTIRRGISFLWIWFCVVWRWCVLSWLPLPCSVSAWRAWLRVFWSGCLQNTRCPGQWVLMHRFYVKALTSHTHPTRSAWRFLSWALRLCNLVLFAQSGHVCSTSDYNFPIFVQKSHRDHA